MRRTRLGEPDDGERRHDAHADSRAGPELPAGSHDERVVEVVVSADDAPYLIGQRVLVKFMKAGQRAGVKRPNQ